MTYFAKFEFSNGIQKVWAYLLRYVQKRAFLPKLGIA